VTTDFSAAAAARFLRTRVEPLVERLQVALDQYLGFYIKPA
jgi:hypothetical protein